MSRRLVLDGEDLVSFSVGVDGAPPYTFQWFQNDQPVFRSNKAVLGLGKARALDGNTFYVVVSNRFSSATSEVVTVNLKSPSVPLTIQRTEQGLTVSWPAEAYGFTLQERDGLEPQSGWNSIPNTENDVFYVIPDATLPRKFYRLFKLGQ